MFSGHFQFVDHCREIKITVKLNKIIVIGTMIYQNNKVTIEKRWPLNSKHETVI